MRVLARDLFRRQGHAVQRGAQLGRVRAASLGQHDAAALPFEQLDGQVRFQRLHLMAHRAVRHAELVRRLRHAAVVGDGLEGAEHLERRQAPPWPGQYVR